VISSSTVIPKVSLTQGTGYIPYVKGVSEKFTRIGNRYIRMFFKTKHTLRSSLIKTRPERDPQQTAQCIYNIPCERGGSYIGETGRPLAVNTGTISNRVF
jgi:hypothetical protein